jgi:hypothetical protein
MHWRRAALIMIAVCFRPIDRFPERKQILLGLTASRDNLR